MKAAPWGAVVEVENESLGSPFRAATGGQAYEALDRAGPQDLSPSGN